MFLRSRRTLALFGCITGALSLLPACRSRAAQVCETYETLCSSAKEGGAPQIECDPDKFDDVANTDEVATCMDAAKDCTAAYTCISKTKLTS